MKLFHYIPFLLTSFFLCPMEDPVNSEIFFKMGRCLADIEQFSMRKENKLKELLKFRQSSQKMVSKEFRDNCTKLTESQTHMAASIQEFRNTFNFIKNDLRKDKPSYTYVTSLEIALSTIEGVMNLATISYNSFASLLTEKDNLNFTIDTFFLTLKNLQNDEKIMKNQLAGIFVLRKNLQDKFDPGINHNDSLIFREDISYATIQRSHSSSSMLPSTSRSSLGGQFDDIDKVADIINKVLDERKKNKFYAGKEIKREKLDKKENTSNREIVDNKTEKRSKFSSSKDKKDKKKKNKFYGSKDNEEENNKIKKDDTENEETIDNNTEKKNKSLDKKRKKSTNHLNFNQKKKKKMGQGGDNKSPRPELTPEEKIRALTHSQSERRFNLPSIDEKLTKNSRELIRKKQPDKNKFAKSVNEPKSRKNNSHSTSSNE